MGCYNQYKARDCSYAECKSQHMLHTLALWGLVTNYGEGGATKWQGAQEKFCPYKRGGERKKGLAVLKGGGGTTSFEVVLTWELEVLAIVMVGGHKKFLPFKVRLRWLGAGLQHPGKIYSFLFSINILKIIINH